ncbi:MAG TPA: cupin domain-containing protein [Candidatus Binatia bacterium]|nr:cupin domain-containing protein [Candidatus Binatia bacterium]
MASVQISKEEMLKRVARFKELKPIDYKAMGSGYVPVGMEAFSIIGQVTKDIPSIEAPHGFTMAVTKVDPGKGAPLHSHKTAEVFVPLSGQWAFYWGDKGENELTLGPWDVISFPAGLMEGFRNLGNEPGYLLAILGAPEVGEVTYAPQVRQA